MKPINKKKIVLIAFFSIFVLEMVGIFVLIEDLRKGKEEILLQKNNLKLWERKFESAKKFKIFFHKNSQQLQSILNTFLDPQEPIEFIKFLEEEAEKFNLSFKIKSSQISSLKKTKKDKKSKKEKWPTMNFDIAVEGDFPDILKFLERVEKGKYLTKIKNLTLTKKEKKQKEENFKEGEIKGNILIEVVCQKEK